MIELKPCPFCGAEPNAHTWQWRGKRMHKVHCEKIACLIRPSTNGFDTPGEAAAAWNVRHEALQYTRLAELAQAERDGRLVVLPCKVGDTVYEANKRGFVSTYEVISIHVSSCSILVGWNLVDGIYSNLNGFEISTLGKTVFLTREEAEAALKKREED